MQPRQRQRTLEVNAYSATLRRKAFHMPRPQTGHSTAHGRHRRATALVPHAPASSRPASDRTDASTSSAPESSDAADAPPGVGHTNTSGGLAVPGPRVESPIGTHSPHETVVIEPSIPANPHGVTKTGSTAPGATRKRLPEAEQLALPGMDEWVQEQLKRAPARSRAWAQRVAAIYGLELPDK
jgi:hypothetical protein